MEIPSPVSVCACVSRSLCRHSHLCQGWHVRRSSLGILAAEHTFTEKTDHC